MAMKKAKKSETLPAVKEEVPTSNLPAYLAGYTGPTGTEGIESDDIALPRIKIGQDMTPAVQNKELVRGDLYLNITSEKIVGPGEKLEVVLLARNKEYILWRPQQDNGGGILARARPVQTPKGVRYAWDKPNQSFEVKIGGKAKVIWKTKTYIDEDNLDQWGSEVPGDKDSGKAATAHHNYVVAMPSTGALAAFSLAKSQDKKAKALNAMLKQSSAPMWARKFNVWTVDDKDDAGHEFKNIEFRPNGFVTPEQFAAYNDMAQGFAGRNFTADEPEEASKAL